MLVLDDLGKESSSRWSLMTLFTIVNARYEGMRPTVITSQYTLGQLRARLASTGEAETAAAIVSRIAAMCADVTLSGPDLRGTPGNLLGCRLCKGHVMLRNDQSSTISGSGLSMFLSVVQ